MCGPAPRPSQGHLCTFMNSIGLSLEDLKFPGFTRAINFWLSWALVINLDLWWIYSLKRWRAFQAKLRCTLCANFLLMLVRSACDEAGLTCSQKRKWFHGQPLPAHGHMEPPSFCKDLWIHRKVKWLCTQQSNLEVVHSDQQLHAHGYMGWYEMQNCLSVEKKPLW